MYVARHLSEYIRNPDALALPPDGPNSGYLVIQDEESETYSCFGLCKNRTLQDFPFPQNKDLTVRYVQTQSNGENGVHSNVSLNEDVFISVSYVQNNGEHSNVSLNEGVFIPVLNLPLSSNRYYVIKPHGSHKGEAFTCSKEEDKTTCCFCRCIKDIKPKPFDPRNIYQQFEVFAYNTACVSKGYFYAKSVADDGFPPYFMRRKGWSVSTKTPKNYRLDEAPGLNAPLRARLPDFNFPPSYKTSEAVVVGKWYSPFMFVKEGTLRDQVERSTYYQVTLEQRWEQIFSSQNNYNEKSVNVSVTLDLETAYVSGNKAVWDEQNEVEGTIWFRSFGRAGEETTVGLSVELFQRMKWEQERGGWLGGKEKQVKVERVEKFGENGDQWREFGCYVLVESFVIKRMDGSLAMTYDFRNVNQIKCRWE